MAEEAAAVMDEEIAAEIAAETAADDDSKDEKGNSEDENEAGRGRATVTVRTAAGMMWNDVD